MSKRDQITSELEKLVRISTKGLSPKELKAASGLGEDVATAGGNLTRAEILKDIIRPEWAEGTIYERCRHFDVSPKANGAFMVITKQTSRTTAAGILGGFMAYNIDEGVPPTFTKGQFDQSTLSLHQKGVICRATNALIQDSLVFSKYLRDGFEETLRYYTDYEILYGNEGTSGQGCNGILADGDRATKYYAIANPISVADLKAMMGYYYGGKNGCWVMGYDIWLEVVNLYANTLPLRFYKDGTVQLFGFPVIVKDDMKTRNIVIGDFSQYFFAQKPIREDMSEHLYYASNETAFRSIFRMNGMPIWDDGITTNDGLKVYPFVANAGSNIQSSSSSSSSESSSSSSKSSASLSSASSASLSSASSNSSSSNSSNSSSSASSNSSSSSSQSSGAKGPCLELYTASGFATSALNGIYTWAGRHNNRAYYFNGSKMLFWSSGLSVWAIANTVGAAPANWLSNGAASTTCPNGTYTDESGTIA